MTTFSVALENGGNLLLESGDVVLLEGGVAPAADCEIALTITAPTMSVALVSPTVSMSVAGPLFEVVLS